MKAEEPIKLANLLTKPAHSIINQASDSRLRLDAGSAVPPFHRRSREIGTHGCVIFSRIRQVHQRGWVRRWMVRPSRRIESGTLHLPCADSHSTTRHIMLIATPLPDSGSITPAWSNLNLHRLADKIRSPLVFAHVRASTTGALSEENT